MHTGMAIVLLAVMTFLFVAITYQLISDRLNTPTGRADVRMNAPTVTR